ncbi:MAG: NUDIX domain-containing protein [Rickettsiales bacterium]|jgi:isopentenyl-diphosphate delta-isomerase|nr:NUDIX domain-containing protein [Rickettsiales bacterium]
MTEEVIVVNEQNEVIGSLPRNVAAKQHAIVRIVCVLVYNTKGNIILSQHSKTKASNALKWNWSAGGHLDAGEEIESGALRELKEELGINGKIEFLMAITKSINKDTGKLKAFIYTFKVIHDGPYILDKREHESHKEYTSAKLSKLLQNNPEMFSPSFITFVKQMGNL